MFATIFSADTGVQLTIEVVPVHDGSVAMYGAVELLRAHESFTLLDAAQTTRDLPALGGGERVVLLVDPFSTCDVHLNDMPDVPKRYAVLAMSARTHPDTVRQALQVGVAGYVSKAVDAATLLDAISAVGVGGIYLGQLLNDLFKDETTPPPAPRAALDKLTPRERDVLAMVAMGLTHRQIGSKLQLSKATVDTYVHRVRQKAGTVNKAGLTRLAMDLGLLYPETVQSSA
ncbi:response regulator transcription factor [Micromonospora sp. NPDC049044]|uniref:helix-turn-helix transcriptional regulator n=1 Tax=unclassified Micromonospora TaxID=2617518 RepID=UPI0033C9CDFB